MDEPHGPDYDDGTLPPSGMPDREARTWALILHLSPFLGWIVPWAGNIVLPLVIWLIKREEHPFVDDQGKEAVNFQITVTIATAICALLFWVFCIGVFLGVIVAVVAIVLQILAAVQAYGGAAYRYPFSIRLIK